MNQVSSREAAILRRVKAARKAAGLSQEEMARLLGLSKSGYGHYDRGRQPFTIEQLFQLSRILSVPVEQLLGLPTELTEEEQRVVALFRRIENPQLIELAISTLEGFAKVEAEEKRE